MVGLIIGITRESVLKQLKSTFRRNSSYPNGSGELSTNIVVSQDDLSAELTSLVHQNIKKIILTITIFHTIFGQSVQAIVTTKTL